MKIEYVSFKTRDAARCLSMLEYGDISIQCTRYGNEHDEHSFRVSEYPHGKYVNITWGNT